MIFTLKKLLHYLLENPFVFYIDHQTPTSWSYICWLLIFQGFEVIVWPGHINVRPNHLSRIQTRKELSGINDNLPDTYLFRIEAVWKELANIVQFLEEGPSPKGLTEKKEKKILSIKEAPYTLVNGSLYKLGQGAILCRCVL